MKKEVQKRKKYYLRLLDSKMVTAISSLRSNGETIYVLSK